MRQRKLGFPGLNIHEDFESRKGVASSRTDDKVSVAREEARQRWHTMCVTHVGKQGALLHTVIQGPRQWRLCHLVATPSRAPVIPSHQGRQKRYCRIAYGIVTLSARVTPVTSLHISLPELVTSPCLMVRDLQNVKEDIGYLMVITICVREGIGWF